MTNVYPPSLRDIRSSALAVGGVVIAIWAYRTVVLHRTGTILFGIAIVLIVLGTCWPRSLAWPYRAWMAFGTWMGRVVSSMLLAVIYLVIVTPIALLRRIFVRDALELRFDPHVDSYFHEKQIQPRSQLERMF